MKDLTVYEEKKETTDQRRRRLATELNLIKQQFNSKLAEVLEEELDVDMFFPGGYCLSGDNALMVNVVCSYQTKRKYYRG